MVFDHIGIFCADLESGAKKMADIFPGLIFDTPINDEGLKVSLLFCTDPSGVRYEIVAPHGDGNPVSGVLQSGKAIFNHVAYRVDDLYYEANRLRDSGAIPLGPPRQAVAFGGCKVMFFLPPLRFIVELIENTNK